MDQLLGSVIEMWVDRMDNITQPERRKLSSLALLSLLPSDNRCEFITLSCAVALCNCITQKWDNRIHECCSFKKKKKSLSDAPQEKQLMIQCVAFTGHGFFVSGGKDLQLRYEDSAFAGSCLYAASNLVFTHVILKLQARSGSGSHSLESNHQRVVGPDRIRTDTPYCAWQRIFNMMPASICRHGYQFEIVLGAQLQTRPMMHFARPGLCIKLFPDRLSRVREQVFPYLQSLSLIVPLNDEWLVGRTFSLNVACV